MIELMVGGHTGSIDLKLNTVASIISLVKLPTFRLLPIDYIFTYIRFYGALN